MLDGFKPYLCRRWNEGCTDGEALSREIAEQGFRGSVKTVRRFLQPFRAGLPMPASISGTVKPRQATGWIVTDPDPSRPNTMTSCSGCSRGARPWQRSPAASASSPR